MEFWKAIFQAWKVLENNKGRGKVMENDAVFNGIFTTALSNSVKVTQINRNVNTARESQRRRRVLI